VVSISSEAEKSINGILRDVRRQSNASETSVASFSGSVGMEGTDSSSVSSLPMDSYPPLVEAGEESSTGASGATAAGIDWGPVDHQLNEELKEKRESNAKYKKMLEFRQKLPSWQKQDEILQIIRENQVVVISGETGCGKNTQGPQFILDEAITSGRGSRCHVTCTQPRRISAISG